MLKLAHLADLHITETPSECGDKLNQQIDTLMKIGKDALDNNVEMFLIAGDIFDGRSTIAERNAAIEIFKYYASIAPVYAVYGNHDKPGDLFFLTQLDSHHEIIIAEKFTTLSRDNYFLALMPWINESYITLEGLIRSNGDMNFQLKENCILLAHLELPGSLMDNNQPVVASSQFKITEKELLDTEVSYVALGHIHKHQIFADNKICYCGSPRPTKFGSEQDYGYCLITLDGLKTPKIEFRKAEYTEMITLNYQWLEDQKGFINSNKLTTDVKNKAVKIKYYASSTSANQAREEIEKLKTDLIDKYHAKSMKLEPIIETSIRTRSEEFKKAKTIEDKLIVYWDENQIELTTVQKANVLEKLNILESEV